VRNHKAIIKRRENELLLQSVRSSVDPSAANGIEDAVSQDIDWEYVIQAAAAHRITPLLYQSLHTFCPKAVPELILHQLRELFVTNARRNLFLSSELVKLVKLLESDGISAIAFKGPTLAVYAYGNLALREFLDLDILVRKKDLLRAKNLLISNGYRFAQEIPENEEGSYIESNHALTFRPQSGIYMVDLHWAIAQQHYSFSFNPEPLWRQVESLSFGGSSVLTFRPEQMIIILAMHGSKQCWEQLSWICDVAQLIRSRADLDWQSVLLEAQKTKCFKELLLTLRLANNLVGATVPDCVLKVVNRYRWVTATTRRVTRRLFCADRSFLWRRFQRITLICRLKGRPKDSVVFLFYELKVAITPNSNDYAVVSLPVALSSLYYVIRLMRLSVSYGLVPLIRLVRQ
jgi:Uncharacterised nucleotidyltransferase